MKTQKTDDGTLLKSTDLFSCPDCGGNLYEDEADEGPKWYECEKCDFSCDSDYDRATGEIFPDLNAQGEARRYPLPRPSCSAPFLRPKINRTKCESKSCVHPHYVRISKHRKQLSLRQTTKKNQNELHRNHRPRQSL